MDARLIFGLGVSVIGLAIRWRFPAVHRFVATYVAGAGAGLLVWAAFPSVWWPYAVVGVLALGVVLVGLDLALVAAPQTFPASEASGVSATDRNRSRDWWRHHRT